MQKEKPRPSTESSSSSSGSSTFLSLDHNKTAGAETPSQGSVLVFARAQEATENSKDEELPLPRFSFDGKESQGTFKNTMKHKELNFLWMNLQENTNSSQVLPLAQEPESQTPPSSSIVAKLMGLDSFPGTISIDERRFTEKESSPHLIAAFPSKSSKTASQTKDPQVYFSKPISKKYSTSVQPRPHNGSRLPIEPATWRQQDSSPGSSKIAAQSRKNTTNIPHQSPSVYGEIEKRITELEFKRAGNDLRALKQILGAMHRTRERLENQSMSAKLTIQKSFGLKDQCSNQNFNMLMCQNRETCQLVPAINSAYPSMQLGSPHVKTKSAKVMEMPDMQRVQTHDPKCQRHRSGYRRNAKHLMPQSNTIKKHSQHHPSNEKKNAQKSLNLEQTLRATESMRALNSTTSERGSKMVSTRLQQNALRIQGEYHLTEQTKTDITNLAQSNINNFREPKATISTSKDHAPEAEFIVNIMEQPSPVSVLDSTFYNEGSPSPVKKMSTAFQDLRPSTDEAEWHLENLNQLTHNTRSDPGFNYSQKSESMLHLIHEQQSLNTKPDETAASQYQSVHRSLDPDHEYINKILLASGIFKDSIVIPTCDQLHPACYLINPSLFNMIEETEVLMEEENGKPIDKNGCVKLNQKIKRRIIFDLLNEILVRRFTLHGLFTVGRRRISPKALMEEVYSEIDHLCGMPSCSLDDKGLIRHLSSDTRHFSDNRTTYDGEVPALVLDVERLIFKDLINDIITGEVMGHHDWLKRQCQLLFTK